MNYSSSDETVVTLASSKANGIGAGIAQLTASLDGVSRQITLAPFSATLTGIELNQTSSTIPSDGSFQLNVFGVYDNGQSINHTSNATLSSQDVTIATISSSGLIEPVSAGTTKIDISYGAFSTTHSIEVTSVTINSIQVTPVVACKAIGSNQQFNASATLSDGLGKLKESTLEIVRFLLVQMMVLEFG